MLGQKLTESLGQQFITDNRPSAGGGIGADTVGGQIDGLYTTTVSAEGVIKSGRAKVLGVAGRKRVALLPNLPTLAEQGINGADNLLWVGLVTTAKVPRGIVEKINAEVNRIMRLRT